MSPENVQIAGDPSCPFKTMNFEFDQDHGPRPGPKLDNNGKSEQVLFLLFYLQIHVPDLLITYNESYPPDEEQWSLFHNILLLQVHLQH